MLVVDSTQQVHVYQLSQSVITLHQRKRKNIINILDDSVKTLDYVKRQVVVVFFFYIQFHVFFNCRYKTISVQGKID